MLEAQLNLWDEPADAKCITTNGFIKKNGAGVMGAGIAGQAQRRYPELPHILGLHLETNGNHVGVLRLPDVNDPTYYVAFPVKHNWFEEADIELIERSAHELMALGKDMIWHKILLPRPGCGNGRLVWDEVKPVIEPILDDRVIIVHTDNPFQQ